MYSTAFSVGKFENYKKPIHVIASHFRGTLVILKINFKVCKKKPLNNYQQIWILKKKSISLLF